MFLKKEEVKKLARMVAEGIKKSGSAIRIEEDRLVERIESVIQKNVDEERAIDEEARRLMQRHQSQIATGAVDPQRAYQMIKRQVAKDRDFVL